MSWAYTQMKFKWLQFVIVCVPKAGNDKSDRALSSMTWSSLEAPEDRLRSTSVFNVLWRSSTLINCWQSEAHLLQKCLFVSSLNNTRLGQRTLPQAVGLEWNKQSYPELFCIWVKCRKLCCRTRLYWPSKQVWVKKLLRYRSTGSPQRSVRSWWIQSMEN